LIDRIAIIGAGYAGLSAATHLVNNGLNVDIYEAGSNAGGLAKGIYIDGHKWPIEPFYHHWFYKEKSVQQLAELHGIKDLIEVYSPNTSFFLNGRIKPFDQPQHVLLYPGISLADRYKLGKTLAILRLSNSWEDYEKVTAENWLIDKMGRNVYEKIWKPMLIGKWGSYYNQINMAWFWARIYVRTKKLMYPRGGFQNFTNKIVNSLSKKGVKFHFNSRIDSISKKNGEIELKFPDRTKIIYDKVLLTVSPKIFEYLVDQLPENFSKTLDTHKSMGAVCVIFILKKKILENTYWLNIPAKSTDPLKNDIPFLVFVEHTNMVPCKYYGNNNIVYCANYVPESSMMLRVSDDEIVNNYINGIKKIDPNFKDDNIIKYIVSRTNYASPVFKVNHSQSLPKFDTPINNLYWVSMSHVYPWDRGTNYATDIGKKAAEYILSKN
jgi:protoporphyrinogen oxidase